MDDAEFLHLVLAASMTTEQAARRYRCSVRTIRSWYEQKKISVPARGTRRGRRLISGPLCDLFYLGKLAQLDAFLAGLPAGGAVWQVFANHSATAALDLIEQKKKQAALKVLAGGGKR